MKYLVLAIALVLSSLSQAYLPVESGRIQTTEFEKMNIGHDFLSKINEGSVIINEVDGTVVLDLYQDLYCEPNQPCIKIMPNTFNSTFEISSIEADVCNARTITAIKDNSSAEGLYEEIQINDYSKVNCDSHVLYPTKVLYKSTDPVSQETQESRFYGEALQDLPVSF